MNTINLTDEVLCAYLDGELSPEARVALERQLLSEPGARVRLDRFRENDERLKRAFMLPASADADPLVRLLKTDVPVGSASRPAPRAHRVPVAMRWAMAATIGALAIGLVWRGWPGMVGDHDGERIAAGPALSAELRAALDRNVSGQSRGGVKVLFTFLRSDGTACRQFESRAADRLAEGVACRDKAGEQWQLSVWHESTSATAEGYRTAGGDASPVETLVDEIDASGPLSPAQEAALIEKGW